MGDCHGPYAPPAYAYGGLFKAKARRSALKPLSRARNRLKDAVGVRIAVNDVCLGIYPTCGDSRDLPLVNSDCHRRPRWLKPLCNCNLTHLPRWCYRKDCSHGLLGLTAIRDAQLFRHRVQFLDHLWMYLLPPHPGRDAIVLRLAYSY